MIPRRELSWAAFFLAGLLVTFFLEGSGSDAAGVRARPPGSASRAAPSERPWPVDVPVHLSSNFGEFRGGHLHAGVDIRSFGREGIPCRAVGSGYVSRLRASPYGYGKAVYIKLDSGETAVYAHLSEFAPVIDSVVYAEQVERGRYQVDIYPVPGGLPVREGQIIAYTGRTGAAAPHLHFEMRDAAERPVNPLDIGWALRDEEPPTIRRLLCLPLTPESRVDGRFAASVVELRSSGARETIARDTLRVTGPVGFGAQIVDRAGDSSGNLAPYRVELEIDGRPVSLIEMKGFAYEQTAEVELVYDIARARTRGQHYLLLFRRRGETLGHREFVADGVVLLAGSGGEGRSGDRVHRAVVRATDRAGNASTASWAFIVSPPQAPPSVRAAGTAPGGPGAAVKGELPGFFFFENMMSARGLVVPGGKPGGSGGAPSRMGPSAAPGAREVVLSVESMGETVRTLPVDLGGRAGEVHVVAARGDEALDRDFPDLGFGIAVGEGSLYANTLLYVAAWEEGSAVKLPAGAGMRAVTPGVRLGPVSAAFKAPVEIRFFTGSAQPEKAAVFCYDERQRSWSFRSSSAGGDTVRASVREPGVYAVLVDSLAPMIGTPVVASRKSFATGDTVREVVFSLVDEGCGVDADRTEVYVDGRKQIARWDGFSQKTFVILRDENIIGLHDISIVAADRLGNSTRLATQLQVPHPAKQGGTGGSR